MSLASLIGRPIKIDAATRSLSRPSVARICIEVILLQQLPKRIWIGQGDTGFWQSVTYDSLPPYCKLCAKLGYADHDCSRDAPTQILQQIWTPKPIQPSDITHPNTSGWSKQEKSKILVDVSAPPPVSVLSPLPTSSVVAAPPSAPTGDIPNTLAAQPTSVPVAAIDSSAVTVHSLPTPSVAAPSIVSHSHAAALLSTTVQLSQVTATVVSLPTNAALCNPPLLPFNPHYVSDSDSVAEDIDIVSNSPRPMRRVSAPSSPRTISDASLTSRHAISDPFPLPPALHSNAEDGSWITKRKCKPYQKWDFGTSHMVTRSKSVLD